MLKGDRVGQYAARVRGGKLCCSWFNKWMFKYLYIKMYRRKNTVWATYSHFGLSRLMTWGGETLMQNVAEPVCRGQRENSPRGGVRSPWPLFWLKTSKGKRNLPVRGSTVSHRHAAGWNDLCGVSVKRSEDGLALSQLHNDLYEAWHWD